VCTVGGAWALLSVRGYCRAVRAYFSSVCGYSRKVRGYFSP